MVWKKKKGGSEWEGTERSEYGTDRVFFFLGREIMGCLVKDFLGYFRERGRRSLLF